MYCSPFLLISLLLIPSPCPTSAALSRSWATISTPPRSPVSNLLCAEASRSRAAPRLRRSPVFWTTLVAVIFSLGSFLAAAQYHRRVAAVSDYSFEGRIHASTNATTSFGNGSEFAEAENQINISFSMIEAEAAAGATASASLKGYRALTVAPSAWMLWTAGHISGALPLLEENDAFYASIGDTETLTDNAMVLGRIYGSQGLPDKALAMAQRAQSLNPRSAQLLRDLSELLSLLNRHGDALKYARKALENEEKERGK